MTLDPASWGHQLDLLASHRPTGDRRSLVEEALRSKWEGVQVHAARVLAAWADRDSITRLREWLESNLNKDAGWGVRGVAVDALCKCYQPEDVDWMLERYFGTYDHLVRHEFLPFITALPEQAVRARIAAELRSPVADRREAATIAARRIESWKEWQGQRSPSAL